MVRRDIEAMSSVFAEERKQLLKSIDELKASNLRKRIAMKALKRRNMRLYGLVDQLEDQFIFESELARSRWEKVKQLYAKLDASEDAYKTAMHMLNFCIDQKRKNNLP